jgi:O-antigen/teichoic acid export membrane protein
MPMVSELHSEDEIDEIRRMYQVVTKWIGIVTLPLFLSFAFFPDLAIRWTFGPEYVSGSVALSLLAGGFFLNAVAGPSGNILMAIGNSRVLMYVNVVTGAANAVLNLFLIPRYSFVGAALATIAGYVVMNGLFLLLLYREIDAQPFTGPLLRPGLAATGLWTAIAWLLRGQFGVTLPAFFGTLLLFAPLYAVVVVRFGGVEEEEMRLLAAFEDRLGVEMGPLRSVAERLAN